MALIVNESMPKACVWYDEEGHCIRCFNYGVCRYEKIDCFPKRPPRCPILGEIPDVHGRLLDADLLKAELIKHGHPDTREWYYAEVDLFINECPTVVEASK